MSGDTAIAIADAFDISDYLTDGKLETEGVWRSLGKDKNGHVREVKLARLGTDDYNSMMRKKQRSNQALLEQNDDEAFKIAEKINKEVIAHTIIRGLRVDGVEVPYTASLGLTLLGNRDFHAKIRSMADQADAYKHEQDENVVKS